MNAPDVRTRAAPAGSGTSALLGPLLAILAFVALPFGVEAQQTGTITGRVVDASTGQALGSAQVSVVGEDIGALTASNGRFLIQNVPAGSYEVQAILMGYGSESQQVDVTAGSTAVVDFNLSSAAIDLEEIVVTGTAGAARRREVGNSISSLRASELEVQPIQTTENALTASTAGVQVDMNSSSPGAGGTIRIRGVNSLTQGNRPLIYVDGVRMENNQLPTTISQQARSPLNDINPADIERIEVIKGAAATTLYGTEAAGGVIQVFTKQGTEGRARWTAELTQGGVWSPQIGPDPPAGWFDVWPEGKNLWMEPFLQTGHTQRYNLSVRGRVGDAGGISYYLSGGWMDEDGALPDENNKQLNLRGNVGFSPTEWMTVQWNSAVSQAENVWLNLGNLARGFTLNTFRGPFDYTANDADSVFLHWQGDRGGMYGGNSNTNHFTTGVQVQLTPTSNLTANIKMGLDYIDDDSRTTDLFGAPVGNPGGRREDSRYNSETRTIDVASTYTKDVASVATSTSVGFQVFQNKLLTVAAESRDFAGPARPTVNLGSTRTGSEDRLEEINAGFFVQEQLGFGDRVFLTAGLRIDGNSSFGDDYGLQTYPKLSASYVISDEEFWPEVFNSTKLRAAYGESGKAPGFFDAERTFDPISALEGQPGVTPANQGNPELGPERTREMEGGFETTFWENRISVDATYYWQQTIDALIEVPQPPSTGFLQNQIQNVGEIRNSGIEIAGDVAILRGDVTWNVGTTMSFSDNEVVDLGDVSSIFLGGTLTPGMFAREGYPLPSYFGQVPTNPNEVAAPQTEEQFIGPQYPTKIISLDSRLQIGDNLTFSGRVEHQGGHYQLSHTSYRNTQRTVWPACFDVAEAVKAGQDSGLTAQEQWRCHPSNVDWAAHVWARDFWRVRSLSANYRLPEDFLSGQLGQLTLQAGGRNLWMITTDYGGVEPEAQDDADALTRHEYYQMPIYKSFTFSIRSQF